MTNRSKDLYPAWAIIENRGNKLALMNSYVPIFWMKSVAKACADQFNNGGKWVRVEKIYVKRSQD